MDFAFYFVFFCLIWWIILFILLPIGIVVRKKPKIGQAPSAPINPKISLKFFSTTLISLLITLILWYLIEYHGLNLGFLQE